MTIKSSSRTRMPKAKLIKDNRMNERIYKIADGRHITIRIDDDDAITYWENGEKIGKDDDFVFINNFQDEDYTSNRYLLARMYVPYKRQGLGRATIEMFKEYRGAVIWTRPNDGVKYDDGSYLTEDGPSFVSYMIGEGLIENNEDVPDDDF